MWRCVAHPRMGAEQHLQPALVHPVETVMLRKSMHAPDFARACLIHSDGINRHVLPGYCALRFFGARKSRRYMSVLGRSHERQPWEEVMAG